MPDQSDTKHGFLRLPEVIKRTGLSKTEIYRRIAIGQFPKQVKLSRRVVVWPTAEIDLFCQFPHLDNKARSLL